MKSYIEIKDDLIVGCGQIDIDELPNHYTEISNELYNQITNLPADFTKDAEGQIIEIIPHPKQPEPTPQPTEVELLREQVNAQQTIIDDLLFNIIPNMTGDVL